MARTRELKHLVLMCRDHAVLDFLWNARLQRATGKLIHLERAYAPGGIKDATGAITRSHVSSWLVRRGIPELRPDSQRKIRLLGFSDATDMLTSGHAASLSDQYWLRPAGDTSTWADVSPYVNDFSEDVGIFLVARSSDTISRLAKELAGSKVLGSSPDASLGGDLTKRWAIEGGRRVLIKHGSFNRRVQEPVNELIATKLEERLLRTEDYVPYELRGSYNEQACVCPCMCNDTTELISAFSILSSTRRSNDESLCDSYLRACRTHGVDASAHVEKMIVIDHILCNTDRHWNNFGVLADSETREWLRPAPLFDNGNSLWSDRTMAEGFGPYHLRQGAKRPFLTHEYDQLERYCHDLSWFEPRRLDGFADEVHDLLALNPYMAIEPGLIDAITRAVGERISHVVTWANLRAGGTKC